MSSIVKSGEFQTDRSLVNFIFYYGTTFFKNSGINNPFIISIVFNAVNVLMTMPGMWGVERYGRRRLLLVGAIGMCLCEYIVAIIGATISVGKIAGQKVLIAVVCIYIVRSFSTPVSSHFVDTSPWRDRPSLRPHGDLSPGSSPVKSSPSSSARRECLFLLVSLGMHKYVPVAHISELSASNWLWNFGIGYASKHLFFHYHYRSVLNRFAVSYSSLLYAQFLTWSTKHLVPPAWRLACFLSGDLPASAASYSRSSAYPRSVRISSTLKTEFGTDSHPIFV